MYNAPATTAEDSNEQEEKVPFLVEKKNEYNTEVQTPDGLVPRRSGRYQQLLLNHMNDHM